MCPFFLFVHVAVLYPPSTLEGISLIMFFKSAVLCNHSKRNFYRCVLAYFVFSGAILGVLVSYNADPCFLSMMRMLPHQHVSIVDLLFLILLPFLITSVVSFTGKTYLLFPLSFFKSFLYALMLSSICIVFGIGGWVVSGLLLLTDSVCYVILLWYWIRHVDGLKVSAISDLLFIFVVSLLVGLLDSFFISPYLANLVNS